MSMHSTFHSRLLVPAIVATVFAASPPSVVHAQQSAAPSSEHHVVVPTLTPRPEDVGSIDGIIAAYYAVITGPPGQPRQWGRDRTLYWPGLRFFAASVKLDVTPQVHVSIYQQYVDATDAGFFANFF